MTAVTSTTFDLRTEPRGYVSQVCVVALKELRDSLRNKWFLSFSLLFAVLTCALGYLSMAGTGLDGVAGFGRTAASLINVILLIVPLQALTIGAGALAGERDRGTLEYLLAHPITRGELLAGKFLGCAIALLSSLALGFGAGMIVVATGGRTQQIGGFLLMILATNALAVAMLSVGFLISALCRRGSTAIGIAILFWFSLVFLSDLGLMGGTLLLHFQARTLFLATLANPMQSFKMSVLGSIHTSLDVLGPAGAYAVREYGPQLPAIFMTAIAAWIVLPALSAYALFTRRGDA